MTVWLCCSTVVREAELLKMVQMFMETSGQLTPDHSVTTVLFSQDCQGMYCFIRGRKRSFFHLPQLNHDVSNVSIYTFQSTSYWWREDRDPLWHHTGLRSRTPWDTKFQKHSSFASENERMPSGGRNIDGTHIVGKDEWKELVYNSRSLTHNMQSKTLETRRAHFPLRVPPGAWWQCWTGNIFFRSCFEPDAHFHILRMQNPKSQNPIPLKKKKRGDESSATPWWHAGSLALCRVAFLQSAGWLTSFCENALLLFTSITGFALWCLPQCSDGRQKPSRSSLPQCSSSTLTAPPSEH